MKHFYVSSPQTPDIKAFRGRGGKASRLLDFR
jgi:hypothetical protein